MLDLPLTAATSGSHSSLIRSRKHYPSDTVGGGAIALTVRRPLGCCVRLNASLGAQRTRMRDSTPLPHAAAIDDIDHLLTGTALSGAALPVFS